MIEYVRVQNLKPGDITAKTLYDETGRILLKGEKALTDTAIRVLNQYGYKGIYIDNPDELRRELIPIPEPLIPELTQMQLAALLKTMYENTKIRRDVFDREFMACKRKLHDFIEEMVDILIKAEKEGNLLFELEDPRNMNNWIFYHSINVCKVSIGMAIKLGKSKQEILEIAAGAIYHDMGKAWIPNEIINKKGLSEEEKKIVRAHPEYMFRFLQKHNYSVSTLYAVWQHHEKMDGSGYPSGVVKGKIVQSARIVSCANVYDNLVNMNPYEGASMYESEAIEYLSATADQDTECLRALFQVVVPYPVGTKVRLSNGMEGIVVKNVKDVPLRPILIVGKNLVPLNAEKLLNITITGVIK